MSFFVSICLKYFRQAAQMFQQFRFPSFELSEKQTVKELLLKGMKYCIEFSGKTKFCEQRERCNQIETKMEKETKTTYTPSPEIKSIHFVLFHFSSFSLKRIESVYLLRAWCGQSKQQIPNIGHNCSMDCADMRS